MYIVIPVLCTVDSKAQFEAAQWHRRKDKEVRIEHYRFESTVGISSVTPKERYGSRNWALSNRKHSSNQHSDSEGKIREWELRTIVVSSSVFICVVSNGANCHKQRCFYVCLWYRRGEVSYIALFVFVFVVSKDRRVVNNDVFVISYGWNVVKCRVRVWQYRIESTVRISTVTPKER